MSNLVKNTQTELQDIDKLPKAMSFDSKCSNTSELTIAQKQLLKLMNKRLIESQPLTYSDIAHIYMKYVVKLKRPDRYAGRGVPKEVDGVLKMYTLYKADKSSRSWTWGYLTLKEYAKTERFELYAKTWFSQNLGALVLKGKIMAIPVIEIHKKK